MAELKSVAAGEAGLWAVDRVFIAYLGAVGLLIAAFRDRIAGAHGLLAWHVAGMAAVWIAAKVHPGSATAHWFRHLYPVLYVAACYREMSVLIRPVRGIDFDAAMARLDMRLYGAPPAELLGRIQTPWLTEALQLAYSLFIPAVVLGGVWLWRRRRWAELRYYTFLLTLGFLVSYLGYLLVPVRGPRFHLAGVNAPPLEGLWLFHHLRGGLDWLESAHYDCFPSGHVELTVMAWWLNRRPFPVLFLILSPYTMAVAFATVYLRYHYTIDVVAGALTAGVLLWAGPRLYEKLRRAH
ncbi:MAG: phosphatase PAP2 family protein [Acidobacteria bacterium]|nr:phosphatase PAP2 family protein [Acidobacteriota bacterium]